MKNDSRVWLLERSAFGWRASVTLGRWQCGGWWEAYVRWDDGLEVGIEAGRWTLDVVVGRVLSSEALSRAVAAGKGGEP